MKKLIFISIFFWTNFVHAQDSTTVQIVLDAKVLGIPKTLGVPQKYVDSAVGNKALQSFVLTMQNNLLLQLAKKADIGTTTGGTAEGKIIPLGEQIDYKEFRPLDYGITYADGTQQREYSFMSYSTHQKVNFPNGLNNPPVNTPDLVVQEFGYNSYPNGARKSALDISLSRRFERRYWIDGMGWVSEYHFLEETMMDNITRRLMSGYYPINGNPGFVAMELGHFDLSEPATGVQNAKTFFSVDRGVMKLISTAPGRAAGITLQHYDGTTMVLDFTGGVPQFKMTNPATFGGGSYSYSYGALIYVAKNGNKTYPDAAAAKADGFKVGELFYTRINGIRLLAQVE